MTAKDTNAIEAALIHNQMAAEQSQDLQFFLLGNVSAYDPSTNKIKAIIGNFTNDGQTGLETGWIQINTPWNGQNFGMQIGPYGGGSVTDPTGQQSGTLPEQVLIAVVGRGAAFYATSAYFFNNVLTPPGNAQTILDDYGNATRVAFRSGEMIIRHSSGTYIFMKQDGSVSVVANTSPQTPFTEPSTTTLTRSANFGVEANADPQVENPTVVTASTTLQSLIGVQSDSIPATCQGVGNVYINNEVNGGNQAYPTTTISAVANPVSGTGSSVIDIYADGTGAQEATGSIAATSNAIGSSSSSNTVALSAESAGSGTNTAVGSFTASATGSKATATLDLAVESGSSGAMNLTATANNTATINITADGSITLTAPEVLVQSANIRLGTGTMKRILTDLSAAVYNSHTHSGVQTGSSTTGVPNQTITSANEAQNAYAS